MIAVSLFALCSCVGIKPNRGVTHENIYYSSHLPKVRIKIDSRFEYMPEYPLEEWDDSAVFYDWDTGDGVSIATSKGYFFPDKIFHDRKMISKGMKFLSDIPFHVGTDVYYNTETKHYLARRSWVHNPNRKNIFVIICVRSLTRQFPGLHWANPKNFSDFQNQIIEEFVNEAKTFFTVIE